MNKQEIIEKTGKLFGALWKPFDDESFEFSVQLFARRFKANDFDLDWFKGKHCLDVGCGGGRYSIAIAREGAERVVGVDIGVEGLMDARNRAKDYPQVSFQEASALELPFADGEFDFVFCSGILHHTTDGEKGLNELCRVLKPGGCIYLLLYSTGGVRWPAVMDFRKCLEGVSVEELKHVMDEDSFPANKVRTLADDLKVPLIDFYHEEYVRRILADNGVDQVQRWEKGRFDHEENLEEMINDMAWFEKCFIAGSKNDNAKQELFAEAEKTAKEYLVVMRELWDQVLSGAISQAAAERVIIGPAHHRLLGKK